LSVAIIQHILINNAMILLKANKIHKNQYKGNVYY